MHTFRKGEGSTPDHPIYFPSGGIVGGESDAKRGGKPPFQNTGRKVRGKAKPIEIENQR